MPDQDVWAIAGDGSLQMTMQELSTIVQEGLPVKIAVLHNGYHGMVRQLQELYCRRNYVDVALHTPDFVKLAEAYGIPAMRVESEQELEERWNAHGRIRGRSYWSSWCSPRRMSTPSALRARAWTR